MSGYSGVINEYSKISIDNFNALVSTYFLSHLHLDHINGIEHFIPLFNTKIYASEITVKLILGRYAEFKNIIPYLTGLKLRKHYKIILKNINKPIESEIIDVVLIPSGHCLGSVMFLIKGNNGVVLYTGDFRLPIGYAFDMMTEFKIDYLDTIYLDTTFLKKSCVFLPSREESLNTVLNIIESFLIRSADAMVFINYKVHVDWKYYSQISDLDENFKACMDPFDIKSRVHACFMGDSEDSENFCREKFKRAKSNNYLLTILPSTMWWSERHLLDNKMIHYVDEYHVRVCFAHHSSYSEIVDFISTFTIKTINNCVSLCILGK